MDQEVPASAGRASFRATLRAIPVPLLVTVRVNPMASPAETEGLSADLATSMAAHSTVVEADPWTWALLVASTVAVFGYVAQLELVVGELTCTVFDAPAARSPKEQVKVFEEIEQSGLSGLSLQMIPVPV